MDILNLDIKQLLKEERRKRGLTLNDVAKGIGCSPSYIYRLEKGEREPTNNIYQSMIRFFWLQGTDLLLYQGDVSEFDYKKSKLIDALGQVDVASNEEVEYLLKQIKDYQQALLSEKQLNQ